MITNSTQMADKSTVLVDRALSSLAEQLASGHSEALTNYLAAMGRFHRYSVGNIMLIAFQNPEATHVAGFGTWKSLGRHVKRGERGIVIRVPIPVKKDKSDDSDDYLLTFTTGHVFDIAQTEGEELPQFSVVQGNPGCLLNRLECFASSRSIRIDRLDNLGHGV